MKVRKGNPRQLAGLDGPVVLNFRFPVDAWQTAPKDGDLALLDGSQDTERSQQEVKDQARQDRHEARALELESLNRHDQARRVRRCGVLYWPSGKWTCKLRHCPSCGPRKALSQSFKHCKRFSEMSNPILALYSVSSVRMTDLRATIAVLKKCEKKIRNRVVMTRPGNPEGSVVKAASGSIEVALAANPRRWNVHLHSVLDARGLDVEEVRRQWIALVHDCVLLDEPTSWGASESDRRTGSFGVQPLIKDQRALSVYISKAKTWCPDPGNLPLWKLEILLAATRGQRLVIEWGFHRTAKSANPDSSKSPWRQS